jgi:D-alanyl-D-alanine carboxypeptidase
VLRISKPARRSRPGTAFRVASHSKTFTAAGIFRLHEAGKLHLDDPASRHVHGLDAATGQTTIAQLLSHSSGVVRDGVDASFWQQRRAFFDEAELRAELARPPVIDPNTRFKYSNVGFGLLGLVIEAATGERYADWVSREIVAPFGLKETLPDAPIPHAVPAAAGHGGLLSLGKRFPLDGGEDTRALASATGSSAPRAISRASSTRWIQARQKACLAPQVDAAAVERPPCQGRAPV